MGNNVVTIKTADGKHAIVYGIHIKSQDPADIPENTDAIILETGIVSYLKDPEDALKRIKNHIQYKHIFELAEKRRIPIVFTDLKYKFNDFALLTLDMGSTGYKWMQGVKFIKGEKGKKTSKIGRLLVGGWLVLPFIANNLRLASVLTGKGLKQSGALKKLVHKLHPDSELLYLTVRNAVIAEKAEYLMKHEKKKNVTTILGAGHVGVEDMLTMQPEKRVANIKSLLPILKHVISREYLYKTVQYVYNGSEWKVGKIYEVPSLRALI